MLRMKSEIGATYRFVVVFISATCGLTARTYNLNLSNVKYFRADSIAKKKDSLNSRFLVDTSLISDLSRDYSSDDWNAWSMLCFLSVSGCLDSGNTKFDEIRQCVHDKLGIFNSACRHVGLNSITEEILISSFDTLKRDSRFSGLLFRHPYSGNRMLVPIVKSEIAQTTADNRMFSYNIIWFLLLVEYSSLSRKMLDCLYVVVSNLDRCIASGEFVCPAVARVVANVASEYYLFDRSGLSDVYIKLCARVMPYVEKIDEYCLLNLYIFTSFCDAPFVFGVDRAGMVNYPTFTFLNLAACDRSTAIQSIESPDCIGVDKSLIQSIGFENIFFDQLVDSLNKQLLGQDGGLDKDLKDASFCIRLSSEFNIGGFNSATLSGLAMLSGARSLGYRKSCVRIANRIVAGVVEFSSNESPWAQAWCVIVSTYVVVEILSLLRVVSVCDSQSIDAYDGEIDTSGFDDCVSVLNRLLPIAGVQEVVPSNMNIQISLLKKLESRISGLGLALNVWDVGFWGEFVDVIKSRFIFGVKIFDSCSKHEKESVLLTFRRNDFSQSFIFKAFYAGILYDLIHIEKNFGYSSVSSPLNSLLDLFKAHYVDRESFSSAAAPLANILTLTGDERDYKRALALRCLRYVFIDSAQHATAYSKLKAVDTLVVIASQLHRIGGAWSRYFRRAQALLDTVSIPAKDDYIYPFYIDITVKMANNNMLMNSFDQSLFEKCKLILDDQCFLQVDNTTRFRLLAVYFMGNCERVDESVLKWFPDGDPSLDPYDGQTLYHMINALFKYIDKYTIDQFDVLQGFVHKVFLYFVKSNTLSLGPDNLIVLTEHFQELFPVLYHADRDEYDKFIANCEKRYIVFVCRNRLPNYMRQDRYDLVATCFFDAFRSEYASMLPQSIVKAKNVRDLRLRYSTFMEVYNSDWNVDLSEMWCLLYVVYQLGHIASRLADEDLLANVQEYWNQIKSVCVDALVKAFYDSDCSLDMKMFFMSIDEYRNLKNK